MDDPYPAYADLLRAEEPLYLAQRDMWLVIRYDHVRLAAKNHAGLSSADGIAYHRSTLPVLFGLDQPDHTRLRALIRHDFSPRGVQFWRPFIEQVCGELLDEAVATGDIDLVQQAIILQPVKVITTIVGVPDDNLAKLKLTAGVLESFIANAKVGEDAPEDPDENALRVAGRQGRPVVGRRPLRRTWATCSPGGGPNRPATTWCRVVRRGGLRRGDRERDPLAVPDPAGGRAGDDDPLPGQHARRAAQPPRPAPAGAGAARADRADDRGDRPVLPAGAERLPHRHDRRRRRQHHHPAGRPGGVVLRRRQPGPAQVPRPQRLPDRPGDRRPPRFRAGIHACVGAHLARLQATTFLRMLIERTDDIALIGELVEGAEPGLPGADHLPLRLTPRSSGPLASAQRA